MASVGYNRYWDKSKEERAAMSEDDVRALCRVELMEAGVSEPQPPELFMEEAPSVPTQTFYRPCVQGDRYDKMDIAFTSAEQAEKFISNLDAVEVKNDYTCGDVYYAKPVGGMEIEPVKLATVKDFLAHKVVLQEIKAHKDSNRNTKADYEKALTEAAKITENVWEDWHRCTAKARHIARVREVFEEYKGMCDGNVGAASRFLERTFTDQDCREALGDEYNPVTTEALSEVFEERDEMD